MILCITKKEASVKKPVEIKSFVTPGQNGVILLVGIVVSRQAMHRRYVILIFVDWIRKLQAVFKERLCMDNAEQGNIWLMGKLKI